MRWFVGDKIREKHGFLMLSRITFTKEDLLAISSEDKIVYMTLAGSIFQEAVLLHKLIIFSGNKTGQTEQERASAAQGMYLFRHLGAHLFQGWQDLRKPSYRSIYAEFDRKLSDKGKLALKELTSYFSVEDNLCEKLRNEYAYHHHTGRLTKLFQQIKKEDRLEVLIDDTYANCRFTAFEMMANLSMLETADMSKVEKLLKKLMEEIIKVAKWFLDLFGEYLVIFFSEAKNLQREDLRLENIPLLKDVHLPYFVLRSEEISEISGYPSTGSG